MGENKKLITIKISCRVKSTLVDNSIFPSPCNAVLNLVMFSKSIKESISQETNQGLLAIAAHYLALPLIVAATAGHNQGYGRGQQTTDMIHAELHLHNQVPTICNLSAMHLSRLHSNMGHVKWRTGACLLFGQELSGDPL